MIATRQTVNLSPDLAEALEIMRKRFRYRTISEYLGTLIRNDGMQPANHEGLAVVASLRGYERDAFDRRLLERLKGGAK